MGHVEYMGMGNDTECDFDTVMGRDHFGALDVEGG